MPLKYKIAHYQDITKGITDKVIDGENGKAEIIENFIPTSEKVLKTVDGFEYKYPREAIAPINFICRIGDDLVFTRSNHLYLLDENTQTASLVSTPNSVPFFSHSNHLIDADDIVSYVESQDRVIVTNEACSIPMIVTRAIWNARRFISSPSATPELKAIRAGLPEVNGTITHDGSGSGYNWKYRCHYQIDYAINGIYYTMVGPTTELIANDVDETVTISGVVAPTNDMRVDGSVAQIMWYRTDNNGSTFRFHHASDVSTTNFTDSSPEGTLAGRAEVYDNDSNYIKHYPAPRCNSVAINGNTVYYLSPSETISSDTFYYKNKFIQGTTNSFGSCDLDASKTLADDINGAGSINGKMIIFTKSYIYRIEGLSTQTGEGFIRPIIINRSIGCLSYNSIIETSIGLFFVGNTGVFITNGFNVESADTGLTNFFTTLFKPTDNSPKIYGTYDKKHEILYWLTSDKTSNDIMLVYSIITNGFTVIKPLKMESRCIYMDNFDLLRGEYDGNIYSHNKNAKGFIAPIYNGGGSLIRTKRYGIPFKFKSIIDSIGMPMIRKWGKKLSLTFQSESDVCIGIKSNNDDGKTSKEMKEVRHYGSFVWRDDTFFWDNQDTTWRRPSTNTSSRHFPKKGLRFRRKQIEIYPKETVIFKSDLFGLATIVLNVINPLVPARYEITLNSGENWPDDIIDYSIVIGDKRSIIQEVNGKKIIAYGTNFLESTASKWEIWGINKNQKVELHSYSLTYALLREMGDNYQKEDSGQND